MPRTPRARNAPLLVLLSTCLALSPGPLALAQGDLMSALPSGSVGTWELTRRVNPDDAHEMGVSDPETGNWNPHHAFVMFGSAVALDGDTMVVGTSPDDCHPATWAYVFERDASGTWRQTAKLVPSDGHYGNAIWGDCHGFGEAVAVDDDAGVIVVGNLGYTEPGGDTNQGAIYVFERAPDGSWAEVRKFVGPDTRPEPDLPYDLGSHFGGSVTVDDGTVVAGAFLDDAAGQYTGSIYVFQRGPAGWNEAAVFHGPVFRSFLGGNVAISGTTIIAGAEQESTETGPYSGAVHIFELRDQVWRPSASLLPPIPDLGESQSAFGGYVALSEDGRTAVVGAVWSDEVAGVNLGVQEDRLNVGKAYVYERQGAEWHLAAELESPDPDPGAWFGSAVDVSGDVVVVGARTDGTIYAGTGSAYVFEHSDAGWLLTARIRGQDTGINDWLGAEVAVSGGMIAVGAPFDDNRGDGTPPPLDDNGDVPPCVHPQYMWGCDDGEAAGSVYLFHRVLDLGLRRVTS